MVPSTVVAVRVAGFTANGAADKKPCIWVDGVRQDLPSPVAVSEAAALIETSYGTFVAANELTEFGTAQAVLWHVASSQRLVLDSDPAGVSAIALLDGHLILVGYHMPTSSTKLPCYWDYHPSAPPTAASQLASREPTTNPIERHDLGTGGPGRYGEASDIVVDGDLLAVYISGWCNGQACYWLNGTRVDLGGRYAYAIKLHSGKPLIGGQDASSQPGWWENGTWHGTGFPPGTPVGATGAVKALYVRGSDLFLGGTYQTAGKNALGFQAGRSFCGQTSMGTVLSSIAAVGGDFALLIDSGWYDGEKGSFHALYAATSRSARGLRLGAD